MLLPLFCQGELGGEWRRVRPAGRNPPQGGLRAAPREGGVVRHRQHGGHEVAGPEVRGERSERSTLLFTVEGRREDAVLRKVCGVLRLHVPEFGSARVRSFYQAHPSLGV